MLIKKTYVGIMHVFNMEYTEYNIWKIDDMRQMKEKFKHNFYFVAVHLS